MNYLAPETLEAAWDALRADQAMCLAGGQSLVAMMNLGLAAPARLVSLRRIQALRGLTTRADGSLRIGAMTTHAELAGLMPSAAGPALIARTAGVVAYPAVRNRGTIGGSVALADPSADYPVALQAADAVIEVAGPQGARRIPARSFFIGLFETALRPGEIVVAVDVPAIAAAGAQAYEKLALVAGDFAIVSVAAVARAAGPPGSAGGLTVDLAVGGCGPTPIVVAGVDGSDAALQAAGDALAASCDPPGDHRATAAYRRRVLPALFLRAGRTAVDGGR